MNSIYYYNYLDFVGQHQIDTLIQPFNPDPLEFSPKEREINAWLGGCQGAPQSNVLHQVYGGILSQGN